MSIRELFAEFMQLGRVQAYGYEFVALCLFKGAEFSPTNDQETRQDILAWFSKAEKMLDAGLKDGFKAESVEIPRDLEEARQKALEAVTSLRRNLNELKNKGDAADAQACQIVYEAHRSNVVPAIDRFLTVFQSAMSVLDKDSNDARRSVITSAVSEIDDINGVINLISVNASVEAARAGEAGRGFAVIASEIQTLSQRSKQAVHDIRTRLR